MAGVRERDAGLTDGWLSPAAEVAAYEGIRRGDEAAFRAVAEPLQPSLRRLAALTTTDAGEIDALVARAWDIALGGLDMFHWQTPFATWVAGLAVALARAPGRPPHRVRPPAPSPPDVATPGPPDWSDLPWGARWGRSWATLDAVVDELPLALLEVVHAHEVEQWPSRRVCDVLGITEASFGRLLTDGRARLRDALGGLIAAPPATGPLHDAQADAVLRMLRETVQDRDEPLDARTIAAFRRWRAGRRWRWPWRPHRSLVQHSLPTAS